MGIWMSAAARCLSCCLILGLISSCTPSSGVSSLSIFPIDTTFSDFYKQIGGASTLGPAISTAFTSEGITYQYVVSGLMVYDPRQAFLERFHFSALATGEWRIKDLAEPPPADSGSPYVNGHQIWEEVLPFYNQYGVDIIGVPVTSIRANDVKQRYEQYFEGLGFYRNYADPPGQIYLLPYGVWMCGNNCPYRSADSTPPKASFELKNTATEQLFIQASERLGYGFTGAPLADAKLGTDGNYEMVFENVILFIDPAAEGEIRLRPLSVMLGIETEKPGPEREADWLNFYKTQGKLGFNVPDSFVTYIGNHGGVVYSGAPISEYKSLTDGGYSQCFTNMCLEFHPTAPLALQTRPNSLGVEYMTMGENVNAAGATQSDALQIDAWEDYPLIASGKIQGITVEATQNKLPVSGLRFSLLVTQPDGITKTFVLAPTGDDGRTHVELDPINGPNGAIVLYKVCLQGDTSPQICFSKSYTIWNQ
jgi:hypothetical protein